MAKAVAAHSDEYPELLEGLDRLIKNLVDGGHRELALQAREVRAGLPVGIENARLVVGLHADIVGDAKRVERAVEMRCRQKLKELAATVERELSADALVQAAHSASRKLVQDAQERAASILQSARRQAAGRRSGRATQ